jgi:hypothetical protein
MSNVSTTTSTRERALKLLGDNVPPTMVASALGVSDSAISQLLSDEQFASQVVELKYKSLLKHTQRDSKADQLEDLLLEKLLHTCEFLMDPLKIAAIYAKVNAAKRRGSTSAEISANKQTVIPLMLPSVVINQFSAQNIQVNMNNQVIRAGSQELITIPSSSLDAMAAKQLANQKELLNEPSSHSG